MQPIFTGTATAVVTPFFNGGVDLQSLGRLIEFQIQNGVRCIVVNGTTGEAPTLTEEEKNEIIRYAVRKVDGRVKLIAGCGSPSTVYAARLSANAEKLGADAVLAVTPYYNKATENGIYLHYKTIADAVKIPVFAYNVPARTGLNIPVSTYERLAEIPNFHGVKEASANVTQAEEISAKFGKRLTIYSGCDELISPIYAVGGSGVVSVVSNILPKETVSLCNACENGTLSEAAVKQVQLNGIVRALFSEVNPAPVKTALSLMGLCSSEMRLPMCPMTEGNLDILKQRMQEAGLL